MFELPPFVEVVQRFPNRAIADIPGRIREEMKSGGILTSVPRGGRIAIGVGSRGISNIATIVRTVVDIWKEHGAHPFIFPAMGSHGAATAEGQADVLAHYGIDEALMGVPVLSSVDVVPLGKTAEGIETFMDRHAWESDGVFLVGRVKWHTDFAGAIESGLTKMMGIGIGKFAGARQYHTFGYRVGLETVIRTTAAKIHESRKVLGGLAIQEGAHHETAGQKVISAKNGINALIAQEEGLLREVKSWKANLPAPEIDVLIVDEIGKDISGAGMDTKVINRSIHAHYNPFPDTPRVHRIYVRGLSANTYRNGVGIGMADVIHDRLLAEIDWTPTYINSLTASTPAAIRTPVHFASDRACLEKIASTTGKIDLHTVTYCRIRNTLELARLLVSENLVESLFPEARVAAGPSSITFDDRGDFGNESREFMQSGGRHG